MELKLPEVKLRPEVKMRKVDLPKVDLPKVDLPKLDLPKVDFSKVELPSVDFKRPEIDLPKLSLKDAGRVVGDVRESINDRIDAVNEWRRPRRQEGAYIPAGLSLLGGLGTGMALMYFFDPEQGTRRRSMLRDRFTKLSGTATRQLAGTAKQVQDRGKGLASSATGAIAKVREGGDDGDGGSVATQTPDVSAQLQSTDYAAGGGTVGTDVTAGTAGVDLSSAYGGADAGERDTSAWTEARPEVYGQPWGETTLGGSPYEETPTSRFNDPDYQGSAREAFDPTMPPVDGGPFGETTDESGERNVHIRLSSEG